MNTAHEEKILVIKLSALGDFIQALGPMAAIRRHHPGADITLLTTKMFESFGHQCGYFDHVCIDQRPKWHDVQGWLALRKKLINGSYTRVYDLQNNDRSCFYFKLFPKNSKPEWIGTAKGASHENKSPARTAGHALEGHKQTLALAGIKDIAIDDLSWINEDLSKIPLKPPYILLVPGSAPQHPQKRWPAAKYAELANTLLTQGYQPVLLGTAAEADVTSTIHALCPQALNLTGQTSLFQIAALAHNASAAIGNDTGPMHMIGPTGCPSLVLFSSHSKPDRHAPKGEHVSTLQEDDLNNLETQSVLDKLKTIMP